MEIIICILAVVLAFGYAYVRLNKTNYGHVEQTEFDTDDIKHELDFDLLDETKGK